MHNEIAKFIIVVGAALIGLGLLVLLFGKITGLGRLPGDIVIQRENFTFYAPLATGLIISIIIMVILLLLGRS